MAMQPSPGGVPGIVVQDCSFGSNSSVVPRGYCFECPFPWHPHVPLSGFSSGTSQGTLTIGAFNSGTLPSLISSPSSGGTYSVGPAGSQGSSLGTYSVAPTGSSLGTFSVSPAGSQGFSPGTYSVGPAGSQGSSTGTYSVAPSSGTYSVAPSSGTYSAGPAGSPGYSSGTYSAGPAGSPGYSSGTYSVAPPGSSGTYSAGPTGSPGYSPGTYSFPPVFSPTFSGTYSGAPAGSPGITSGTYSSAPAGLSGTYSLGSCGSCGSPLDANQMWWDAVGGFQSFPLLEYSQVEGGPVFGSSSSSSAGVPAIPAAAAAAVASPAGTPPTSPTFPDFSSALVPAFPGARSIPGPLMVPPHGVFGRPAIPPLRVDPGRGQPYFAFPAPPMGFTAAPQFAFPAPALAQSPPPLGATAGPQKLTEGKPREQRAQATSLSSTRSGRDGRQVTLERIVGEITFQLDRRILSSIFPDRIRLYGYTVGNIPEKISQGGNDPLSPLSTEQRSSMLEHYNAIMARLKPLGYDPNFHPQFTEHIVNTYGILRERPDNAGVEGVSYNDPVYLREVIENVVPQDKRLDCILLLQCLQMLSKADGKPLFIW